jgi:uncharacterized protein
MNQEAVLAELKEAIRVYFGEDSSGHDVYHTYRVYQNAEAILKTEPSANRFLVLVAALLHDVDDVKLFPADSDDAHARKLMSENNLSPEDQKAILHIIHQVSFKGKDSVVPDTLEGKIVQDSDRLDAIGAIGIARAFAYGGSHGRLIYDPNEKPVLAKSEADYRKGNHATLTHFYEKLLLLKDMMTTPEGKKMAEKRHQVLVDYLNEFHQEINGQA